MNSPERLERQHLQEVLAEIDLQRAALGARVERAVRDTTKLREYFWDSLADMDGAEKTAIRGMVTLDTKTNENTQRLRDSLDKARQNPYFARIDFARADRSSAEPCYIGLRGLARDGHAIVHDWRAPLSGMFYDHEQGPAGYTAPEGPVHGEIELKRQFVIRNARLEAILDSSVSIDDDVLKRELSAQPDEKMKNIVATIQREQNSIIRDEDAEVLIIQGAAGSGKTSIALHRVAYMLYRFSTTIDAKDVLILSPNRVFGDYISNVLPELGEETIPEMVFEQLAVRVLGQKLRFQHLHEQIEILLTTDDPQLRERIRYKSGFDFYQDLRDYLENLNRTHFRATDVGVSTVVVTAAEIEEWMRVYRRTDLTLKGMQTKLSGTVLATLKQRATSERIPWLRDWTTQVRRSVDAMFVFTTVAAVYKNFFAERGAGHLFKKMPRNTYEYSDLFPLAYTALHVDKRVAPASALHVLVDEMQDYSPVHYAVLERLYRCRMTILGDAYQAVHPDGSSLESIAGVFPQAHTVRLGRSYRSTLEIAMFAQQISPNPDLVPFDRHGEEPTLTAVADENQQLAALRALLGKSSGLEKASVGIICRTGAAAARLHARLAPELGVQLLDHTSEGFAEGAVITTAHMAKGLEFEHVVVADASDAEYGNDMGRRMLYVACTRATNRLDLLAIGDPARWLP